MGDDLIARVDAVIASESEYKVPQPDGVLGALVDLRARVTVLEATVRRQAGYVSVLEGRQDRIRALAERPNTDGYWLPEWVRRELRKAVGS